MKVLVLLVIALAGVGLLVANGNVTFDYGWVSDDPSGPSSETARSQTVREVIAVVNAAAADPADLDNAQFRALVAHVHATRDRAATRLVERELPQLSRRAARKLQVLYARVARLPVTTRVGTKCRATTLRFLARQRLVFGRFARQVAREGATPVRVDGFAARVSGVSAWYEGGLRSCRAGATREDRVALEAALSR